MLQIQLTIYIGPYYKFATMCAFMLAGIIDNVWPLFFSMILFFMRVKYEMEVTRRRISVLVEIAAAFNMKQIGFE